MRVPAVAYATAATLLMAVLGYWTWDVPEPLPLHRIGAIALGFALGLVSLRAGLLAVVFLTPLVEVIGRLNGVHDLSLAEHLLVPLLLCGIPVIWRSRHQPVATPVGRPLTVFCLIVVISMITGLWEYRVLPQPVWQTVLANAERHFSFDFMDVSRGPFGLVHQGIVILEAAMFFALLSAPALRMRAADLRGVLVCSAVVVAVLGVAQSLWPVGIPIFFLNVQPDLLRVTSTFPDPNTLGTFLILVGPLVVISAWATPAGTIAAAGAVALLGCCLIQTVSRSAWVGLATALFAIAVLAVWRPSIVTPTVSPRLTRTLRRALVFCGVSFTAAIIAVSLGVFGRGISHETAQSPLDMLVFTLDMRRPANDLLPSRIDHWDAALRLWRDFPVFGAGIGKYIGLKLHYLPEANLPVYTGAHNYYLKILSELGLVGLASFLALLHGIFAAVRQSWSRTDDAARQRIAAIGVGLLAFSVSSLAQDPLGLGSMQRVFWAMVALVILERREAIPSDAGPDAIRGGGRRPS